MTSGQRNKLTGQIGEHLVSAMLGSMGYYAAPYSGNVPGFDITAVSAESLETKLIQVKTSNGNTLVHSTINKWVEHSIDSDNFQHLGSLLEIKHTNIIWIMVQLSDNDITKARYFICSEQQIQKLIVQRYRDFMKLHNNRRPQGGNSLQAILDFNDLLQYENNWQLLTNENRENKSQ